MPTDCPGFPGIKLNNFPNNGIAKYGKCEKVDAKCFMINVLRTACMGYHLRVSLPNNCSLKG
jgi:hypothetical protein